jgi:hypothetical protein
VLHVCVWCNSVQWLHRLGQRESWLRYLEFGLEKSFSLVVLLLRDLWNVLTSMQLQRLKVLGEFFSHLVSMSYVS